MSDDELKPCPLFCGGHAVKVRIGNEHTKKQSCQISCSRCTIKYTKAILNGGSKTYEWIENIKMAITAGIKRRGSYRRMDMPHIVHKYFDDMFRIMSKVYEAMNDGGRFILVVGDSLIADVYIPTDLLIARIGQDIGLHIEGIEKARERRSGQIRSYKLRETIITLKKE